MLLLISRHINPAPRLFLLQLHDTTPHAFTPLIPCVLPPPSDIVQQAWTNSEVGGSGWREAMVPESGHVYYYNDQTGESSWVAPAGVGLTSAVVEGAGGLAGATGVGGAVALEVAAPRPTTQVLKSSASRDTRARWMNSNYGAYS